MQDNQALPKTKIFFPNLDGLRFISFFVVFLYHCYLSFFSYVSTTNPGTYKVIATLFKHGNLGVNFFFVLSGFLITYLLIREKELKGSISVPNFYVRRILRIWPLYYLCLFIGFVLFAMMKKAMSGQVVESADPFYYIFFAANFDYMHTWPLKPEALNLSVLWSVAVEEQFYLTWPLILASLSLRKYKYVFPAIMLFSLIFRSFHTGCSEHEYGIRYFHTFSLIGDMALGGLLAYFSTYENKFKRFVTNLKRSLIILLYLMTIAVCVLKDEIFPCGIPVIFERLVIGALFGMIIVEQNYAKHSLFKLSRFKMISKLGTYTYGLYCLHLLGMYVTVKLVTAMHLNQSSLLIAILSAVLALGLSIIISTASYHFFEKWFLKIKARFSVIITK